MLLNAAYVNDKTENTHPVLSSDMGQLTSAPAPATILLGSGSDTQSVLKLFSPYQCLINYVSDTYMCPSDVRHLHVLNIVYYLLKNIFGKKYSSKYF